MSLKKIIPLSLIGAVVLQMTSCGVLFHPERKGQTHGDIDAKVAIMDGLLVLLGVVPGIIAFTVDFYEGTIFLPSSGSVAKLTDQEMHRMRHLDGTIDIQGVNDVVNERTGQDVFLTAANTEVKTFASKEEIKAFQQSMVM